MVVSTLLAVLGAGLAVLNLATDGLYDSYGGSGDPLLRTTTASIIPDTPYKYAWAVLSALVLSAAGVLTSRLALASQMSSAGALVQCLADFCSSESSPAGQAVMTWRRRSKSERGIGVRRRLVYWLACIPVMLLTSTPACACESWLQTHA